MEKQKEKKFKFLNKDYIGENELATFTDKEEIAEEKQKVEDIKKSITKPHLYCNPQTGQMVRSLQTPIYFDAKTGKIKQAELVEEQEEVEQPKKGLRGKLKMPAAGFITAVSGLILFAFCYFLIYLTTGISNGTSESGMFWGLVIVTWVFGPLMMVTIPPVCYLLGLIFAIVGCFSSPKRLFSWISLVVCIIVIVLGLYLFTVILPTVF
ncbi:MAG: hypothetical protein IJZ26_02210 [Clostridia bacterium]|nr:hypothetical protein [Clostridia bacterium]